MASGFATTSATRVLKWGKRSAMDSAMSLVTILSPYMNLDDHLERQCRVIVACKRRSYIPTY